MLKHHLIRRTVTGGLVIAAVGLPISAQAKFMESGGGASAPSVSTTVTLPVDSYSSRAIDRHGSASAGSAARPNPVQAAAPSSTSVAPTNPGIGAPNGGFDWGDAGIGAAGAVVLMGAAAAAVGVTRRRRIQRTLAG
jgi:hypothetical protein